MKVAEKKPEHHRVVLDCQAVNQRGEVVIAGTAEVIAPKDKISRPRVVLPEWNCARRAAAIESLSK